MAQRRMFSKKITETDTFLDMPMSSQCLYFHLNMSADDDGFIGNAKTIKRMIGASDDDLKILLSKEFLIPFENGVVVIKDWKIHNYIQKDRYNETIYKEEKSRLGENESKQYQRLQDMDTKCIQNVSSSDTQVRIGKDRLGKDRQEEEETPAAARDEMESYFGSLTQFMYEDLEFYKDKFDEPNEIIIEAIDICRQRSAKHWNYAKSIIQSWRNHNLKTLSDVRKHEAKDKVSGFKKKGKENYEGYAINKDRLAKMEEQRQQDIEDGYMPFG